MQEILTYFVGVKTTVRLTSGFTDLNSTKQENMLIILML